MEFFMVLLGLSCLTPLHNISVISWRSVLLVEETGVPMNGIRTHNFSGNRHWLHR